MNWWEIITFLMWIACEAYLGVTGSGKGRLSTAATRKPTDLGWYFGAGLCAAEVNWVTAEEWVREPGDILW